MVLNTRFQFLILYTAGPEVRAAAVEDVSGAVRDGALPVGTVGKVLVDVMS
jgi:NADPH2:quinone reductase